MAFVRGNKYFPVMFKYFLTYIVDGASEYMQLFVPHSAFVFGTGFCVWHPAANFAWNKHKIVLNSYYWNYELFWNEVRQSSGSRQAVIRQSSGSRQAVVRQSLVGCQAIFRKFSNCQKCFKIWRVFKFCLNIRCETLHNSRYTKVKWIEPWSWNSLLGTGRWSFWSWTSCTCPTKATSV